MNVRSLAWEKVLSTNAVSHRLPDSSCSPNAEKLPSLCRYVSSRWYPVDQETFRLGLDLGFQLPGLFEVFENEGIWGEQDHVLLAAAERHLQELIEPVDGLGQQAAA